VQLIIKRIIVFLNLLIFSYGYAKTDTVYLDTFLPSVDILRGVSGYASLTIPIPDRYIIDKATLHLELSKSQALVPERSFISVFFNGVLVFQKRYDPRIDTLVEDINIPISLLKDYNQLEIKTSQHYCVNCCEYEASPELWTKIYWDYSYLRLEYREKPLKSNIIFLRDYVLDIKQYNPLRFAIMTENKSDKMITFGAKVAGYIGRYIKYRKININYVSKIPEDRDTFLIGTTDYVRRALNINNDVIPNIFLVPNPYNGSKAVIVINAPSTDELENVINAFISLNPEGFIGENISIKEFKNFNIKPYKSPNLIPLNKRINLESLGYQDTIFYGFFSPPLDINFEIPVDLFISGKEKFTFHLFYNYGPGVREDSVINIFVNDKFLRQIKVEKDYGTIMEDLRLSIPVYMLKPGKNKITVQYALMPRNQGFCVAPNIEALKGTVFSRETYIELPDLPHWVEMPYMEYFTMQAFPFSIYPDLSDTQIYLSNVEDETLSAMFTLMAYIGEKTAVSPYNISVTSDIQRVIKNKNLILIGNNFDPVFFENTPIKVSSNNITLKYRIFELMREKIKGKVLSKEELEELENLRTVLSEKNSLQNEVIFTMGKSPFSENKTVFLIISRDNNALFNAIKLLYEPKYVSKIKGDISVVDWEKFDIYSGSLGDKYFVGHLPFIKYIIYRIGYTSPVLFFIIAVATIILIAITLKKILDIRAKRRLEGEI